ncbi:hypothetical protein ACS0TY_018734 [Phlomoides rotata]
MEASEGGVKPEINHDPAPVTCGSKVNLMIIGLRLLAFCSTLSATLVMALNKQTRTIVVATIGSVPIQATLTAKFQDTPANVFFVIANGNATLHNLVMLVLTFVGPKIHFKGLVPLAIPVLDLLNVAIVSGGASAAAFMGQLGRNGNSHARWNKICDKFETYCDRSGGAIIASFVGVMLITVTCSISIIRLRNYYTKNLPLHSSIVP